MLLVYVYIVHWEKRWHIEFEPAKLCALCISHKGGLLMDGIPNKEVETLSVLGFQFDHRLTWAAMIDKMVSRYTDCLMRFLW